MTSPRPMPRLRAFGVRMREMLGAAVMGPGRGVPAADGRARVFFVVHNKNHMTIFSTFAPLLEAQGRAVHFATLGGHRHEGQALAAISAGGRPAIDIGEVARLATPNDIICLGNDWGPRRLLRILDQLKARGVPLAAVVEGARFGLPRLYKHVDNLLCWGPSGLEIGARGAQISGSPTIEKAARLPRKVHDRPKVLVNYKFSGTAEDEGFVWGAAAIAAARAIDPDFVLTTHPSSRGVPAGIRVSHAPFHSLLQDATIIITKASTVVYEALAAGVAVLYFPAADEVRAEFGEPHGAFETGDTPASLLAAAQRYAANPVFPASAAQAFLDRHVAIDPQRPAAIRIASALIDIMAARGRAREALDGSAGGTPHLVKGLKA
jgi:hypothetical protein